MKIRLARIIMEENAFEFQELPLLIILDGICRLAWAKKIAI
jgi:hypothetical protein